MPINSGKTACFKVLKSKLKSGKLELLIGDFVFDVRCLANPFWDKSLRALSGKDNNVKSFIKKDPASLEMITNIVKFLNKWIPKFLKSDRNYLTISIGCTGGQHRSVYITENVSKELRKKYTILVKHRDIK